MYKKIFAVFVSMIFCFSALGTANGAGLGYTPYNTTTPDNEPTNNTAANATDVVVNYDTGDVLNLTAGDQDWFRIYLTAGQYNINVTTSNEAVDPDLYIYDSTGTVLLVSLNNAGGTMVPQYVLDVPSDSYYHLEFTGANPIADYSVYGKYGFSVTYYVPYLTPTTPPTITPFPGAPDIYEPNNTFPPANPNSIIRPNTKITDLTLTANDHDIFSTVLNKGKYAVIVTSSSDVIDPEIKLYDGSFNLLLTSSNNGGSSLDPAFYFDVTTDNSVYYFEIYGAVPTVDYSMYGTYDLTLDYIPVNGLLVEDAYEPNDTEAQARLVGYQTTITGLTMYSYTTKPDIDYFLLVAPRDMDLSCSATSDNSILNLAMSAHIQGKSNMGGYKTEVEQNYIGVNPKIAIHNLESGVPIIFSVYNENPATAEATGGITYTFKCVNGLGIPEPTATPTGSITATVTKTPYTYVANGITYINGVPYVNGVPYTGTGTYGTTGYGTLMPSVTGTPSVLNFRARPSGGGVGAPTQAPAQVDEFVQVNFMVYADTNGNGQADFDEFIKGLNIYLIDKATNTPSNVLTTNDQGSVSISLEKKQMANTRYSIPLLNLGGKLQENVTIKVASVKTSSVLP